MPLEKHFLKPTLATIPVKQWQTILYSIITIVLAYAFYLLIQYCYEFFKYRYFYFGDEFEAIFSHGLTETSWLFKFESAFFALLFSYTFFIKFLFYRPSFHQWHPKRRASRHKVSLFHNATFLSYYFLDGVSRLLFLLFVLGVDFWVITFEESHLRLVLASSISLILLYFYQWNTIRLYFAKSNKWQWMVFGFTIATALLFSVIPPQKLEQYRQSQKEKSNILNYEINLPTAKNTELIERKGLVEYGLLAYPKQADAARPELLFPSYLSEPIPTRDISKAVFFYRKRLPEIERGFMQIVLAVSKNVEMKYLYEVRRQLSLSGNRRISYCVDNKYTLDRTLNSFIPFPCLPIKEDTDLEAYKNSVDTITDFHKELGCFQLEEIANIPSRNVVSVVFADNQLFIDGKKCDLDKMENILLKIDNKKEILVELRIDNEAFFKSYIEILDRIKTIQNLKRDAFSIEFFGTRFDELHYEDARFLQKKFYFQYIDLPPEEWKYIDFLRKNG